jgi:hypothetical protein
MSEPVARVYRAAFSMKDGCRPPDGVRTVEEFAVSFCGPPGSCATADQVARQLVSQACSKFMCSPAYLTVFDRWRWRP